jgi:hypothetical protein
VRTNTLLVCIVVLGLATNAGAAEFYVSPDGQPAADGSKARPWDLRTALAQPQAVRPGDTIWLLGGTYRGGFESRLKGTAEAPITVRQALAPASLRPGTRATIDCSSDDPGKQVYFTVNGEHARYWGFEVMSSNPKRRTETTGSHPEEISRGGVNCLGANISFINMAVHDCSNGFGFWAGGEGGEIYGCIIYNNGWDAPDRGHGHAIYAQNKAGTKRLADNIMFNQFSYGVHAYGSSKAFINNFRVEGNVSFNDGAAKDPKSLNPAILVGGGSPSEHIEVVENYTYSTGLGGTSLLLGYGAKNKDAVVRDNYFVGPANLQRWESLTLVGNTFIASAAPALTECPAGDLAGQNTVVKGRPVGVKVFVRPNKYEPGRANVVVYNWDKRSEVEVDLGACRVGPVDPRGLSGKGAAGSVGAEHPPYILKPGAKFRIVSAQDFFGKPVLAGTYDGKPLRLPMADYRAPAPVGKPGYVPPATGPEFNVFIVLPAE